tara:strand:- start:494 stop:1879 length:1386 start_codon:yes stop_codon:yes gene_type:complete
MPSIRIGYSTDFNLNNELVGIGSTTAASTLDVAGQIVADNTAASGGVSTFREYQGFQQIQQDISNNILIDNGSNGNFNSLSGEIRISGETTVSSSSTITGGKLETLTITDKFAVPLGDTNSRDNTPEAGTTRFNQDFGTLEFFDGNNWKTVNSYSRGGAAGRGLFAGGYDFTNPGQDTRKNIDYVQIATLGNALNFGDLQQVKRLTGGCSSETRGLFMGGVTPSTINDIDHVTIASAGNAVDFGNLAQARYANASLSSSTRGITAGGVAPSLVDQMDYVEIATSGNALDFGDIADSAYAPVGLSNGTRGLFCGGEAPTNTPAGYSTYIYSITIASKGDGVEFGHLRYKVYGAGGGSNSVRGIYAGGGMPADVSNINYITLSTEGNAIDFGNLTEKKRSLCGTASQTRVVLSGGILGPTGKVNTIEYVNIASSGNGFDFGDLRHLIEQQSACSDSHGGLGGF